MLHQLRLGVWDYPHLVALCILTRHVCVRVHTVTAVAHRVNAALYHAAHFLALRFCATTHPPIFAASVSRALSTRNTVDRPAAGRESSRHQTKWTASCMVQRAPLFDNQDRCSMAFASACLLSFLGLYKRYCAIASLHCVVVLHSFRCLLSLQPMPLHASNPPLATPPLTSPPATHLCSETAAQTNAMDSHTANRSPRAESATPEGNTPCPRAQASGPQQFSVSPTGDLLSHASLNVGGPEITPNRLCHLLSGFPTLPRTLCLQEFKPTSAHHSKDYERVALHWNYHLLYDSPTSKNGVAILVHTSISPKPPPLQVHIPGILVSTQLHLHPNPLMPPVRIASFYGPHKIGDKRPCEPIIDSLLRENIILLGDFNGTTHSSHATTLTTNLWPWLIAKEKSGVLTDLLLPHTATVPFTRVRRFAGTKSYIDRAYGSRLFHGIFTTSSAEVIDFKSVHGASDHDPIVIRTIPWTAPRLPEPRCALWNRRDLQLYRTIIASSSQDVPAPECYTDVQLTYDKLCHRMLDAMRQVNSAKTPLATPSTDASDWSQVVKQLARQAKRRSKIFFRRVKHTLLTPPAPSTLPVPNRKIQRILQRNSPWSASATDLIPRHPELDDVPPPHRR